MAYKLSCSSAAGDASPAFRRPAWILLQRGAHLIDSRNETTAAAKSMGGYNMAVSFWMANPPELSFFSVDCSKPPNSLKNPNFRVEPYVVGAEGPFVLLCTRFYCSAQDEYFMYKASDSPSLEWVPCPPWVRPPNWVPPPHPCSLSEIREFGIVHCADMCHYRLAALRDAPSDYQLQIYCSETRIWSCTTLPNPCPGVTITPEKVLNLGEGMLGWVDFSCGLLACDLCQEPPRAHFIPLPVPMPENRGRLKKSPEPELSARCLRDLICINGELRFIEMECRFKEAEKPIDPSDNGILFDADLIMSLRHKNMDEKDKTRDGWRAMIWARAFGSNCWSKRCAIDVNDMVDESIYFLPETRRGKSALDLKFRDMYSSFPTLCPYGDDILYLKSKADPSDKNGWVFAVDLLGNMTTKAGQLYSCADDSMNVFHLCTLSQHLNISPGIEVSACVKITGGDSFANGPGKKSVCTDGLISCASRGEPQVLRALAKAKSAQNEALNDDITCDYPSEDSHLERARKLQRLLMEKRKRARNGGPRVAQNDNVPWINPFKTNMQCFNKLNRSFDMFKQQLQQ